MFQLFLIRNAHLRRRRGARNPKGGIIAVWIRARRFRPSFDVASRPGFVQPSKFLFVVRDMSCRWPPLTYSRDTDRFREQIFKERSHGRPERPLTAVVATAVPRPYNVPNPMYSWEPLAAESRGFGQSHAPDESSMRTSTPYPQFRATPRGSGKVHPSSESLMRTSTPLAQFRTKPFNVDHTMLPQRTPEHVSACSEMSQMSWYEPPLVLSRNYSEPRNFFNKCAERSTRSVVNPAVPVVPWKVLGRSPPHTIWHARHRLAGSNDEACFRSQRDVARVRLCTGKVHVSAV